MIREMGWLINATIWMNLKIFMLSEINPHKGHCTSPFVENSGKCKLTNSDKEQISQWLPKERM